MSSDGLTYTFVLSRAAHWSDGNPVTARDYVFAWRRNVSPPRVALCARIVPGEERREDQPSRRRSDDVGRGGGERLHAASDAGEANRVFSLAGLHLDLLSAARGPDPDPRQDVGHAGAARLQRAVHAGDVQAAERAAAGAQPQVRRSAAATRRHHLPRLQRRGDHAKRLPEGQSGHDALRVRVRR